MMSTRNNWVAIEERLVMRNGAAGSTLAQQADGDETGSLGSRSFVDDIARYYALPRPRPRSSVCVWPPEPTLVALLRNEGLV